MAEERYNILEIFKKYSYEVDIEALGICRLAI
jgi:hypothetical protein